MDTPPVTTSKSEQIPATREAELNPITIFKNAWNIYTLRWITFTGIQLLSFILIMVFVLIVVGVSMYIYFVSAAGDLQKLLPMLPIVFFLAGIGIIMWLAVASIFQLALLLAVIHSEEKLKAIPAFKQALRLVIPFSIFMLLSGFLTTGASLLLIIPGILFSIWFSQATFIYLLEKESMMRSLLKSRVYVKGHMIELLVAFFVLFAATVLATYIPNILVGIIGEDNPISAVFYFLSIPLGFIIGSMQYLYMFQIYKELKRVSPSQFTLPGKIPYLLTAILGYLLFFALFGSIIMAIVPRVSEFMENRATTSVEEQYPGDSETDAMFGEVMIQVNNTKRLADVNSILDAVTKYRSTQNRLPAGITAVPKEITSDGGIDLCSVLLPDYMSELPLDPSMGSIDESVTDCSEYYATGYFISVATSGAARPVVTVQATHAEDGEDITVSR